MVDVMKNKYRLLIFAGCIAVVLSGCSLFYAKNQSPDLTSANERIETDKNTVEDQTFSEDVGETKISSSSEEPESPNLSENTEKTVKKASKKVLLRKQPKKEFLLNPPKIQNL